MFPLCILVMVLCLQFGGLCNAIHVVEISSLQVEFGEAAILPCNGSAYLEEKGTVQWEAMGEDVAILRGGELREGDKFMGRIELPSEEKVREGDWSVVLKSTMFSDSEMYECILEGRKTLSTVWLTVTAPQVERSLVVPVGDEVILTCYTEISRSEAQNELQVWWTKDGNTIISGQIKDPGTDDTVFHPDDLYRLIILCDAKEKCSLFMGQTLMSDNGEYRCLYKARYSDDPRPGIPESITLTVLDTNHTDNVFPPDATSAESPLDPIPVHLEDSTQPIKVMTESQPMEAFEEVVTSFPDEESQPIEAFKEAVTSFPDEGMEETSLQWDTLPWIRIGLIAGVLLVTAMVLCILGALQKI
ncbi:uncharacterized protein LOC115576868 isoform X2 [Sparus aurata]|uniref:uncharacterized protein LOC115576868 isoform X2 n=1 Tax=Sparus aurata TaxID=8175 RepID=UPI0011C18594|nr:uncharacterized protein LOC115576868 isoform X2 [Sparus aurata]